MILRCIRPFGHFEPGDEVEAPDDTEVIDVLHFEPVDPAALAANQPVTTATSNEDS